jgi:hypothetical protein
LISNLAGWEPKLMDDFVGDLERENSTLLRVENRLLAVLAEASLVDSHK